MNFKKGDKVKLITVSPQGVIQSMRMTEEGVVQCLLEWVDLDGVTHQRWFDQDQLEAQ